MSERNRWVPMNRRVTRSGMFGIHKEEVDHITTKLPRSRVLLIIVVLAAIGFLVSLSGLSIYTGISDTNKKMRIFFEQKHRYRTKDNELNNNNNDDDDDNNNILSNKNITNENEEILILSTSTLIPGTIPTIVQPLSRSDDDNHQETTTVKRFIEQQNNISLSEQEIASRHSRAYPVEHNSSNTISKVNRSGRIMTRNKYETSEQSFLYPHPSLPSYSEQYAQLENYKLTTNRMKNVQKVLGITTTGNIPPPPQTSTVGGSTIKFTGVYVRGPSEHLDGHISDGPIYVNPFLNGHAYATDPFVKYKPQHPSEINHLATSTSEIDTGPRFSNKIVRPTKMPPQPTLEQISSGTGTLTEAIFHPYDTPEDDNKKSRPLKIMLDVYPVVEEPENANQHDRGSTRSNKRSNQMKSGQNNRMIVHLNLYPKKTTKVRKRPSVLTSLLPGGGRFEDRMFNNMNETEGDEEILIEEYGVEMPGMEHFSVNNNNNNNNNKDYVDNDDMTTIATATIITNENNSGGVSIIGDDLDDNSEHQAVLTFDDVISSIKTFTTNLVTNKTHNNNNNSNNNSKSNNK